MNDRDYMSLAIELAKKGEGFVNPNPMVGAVIVKDGKIIGQGYHKRYGELHAERDAFSKLTEPAEGATIYVTLEPCCHHGKQPPCTEAIIKNKIARVVIGSRDPNPVVAGKGARLLREKGIAVEEDFMRSECDALNPVFFHYITTKLPYVVMKYAMTADGKIATVTGESQWISCEESRKQVHEMRGKYASILVGIETVLADDPMLNCRSEGRHQPLRIVLDSKLRIPLDSAIVKTATEYKTLVACCEIDSEEKIKKEKALTEKGVEVLSFPGEKGVDVNALIKHLGTIGIDSLLIEGGGRVNEAFVKAGLVNHLTVYVAPKIFGGQNAKSPVTGEGIATLTDCMKLHLSSFSQIDQDLRLDYEVIDS